MRRRRNKGPDAVDVHASMRVRERRIELGLTQQELAAGLGITVQHLYKFEKAKSRMSASRLYSLSRALDVPVTFFFEGIAETDPKAKSLKPSEPSQQR